MNVLRTVGEVLVAVPIGYAGGAVLSTYSPWVGAIAIGCLVPSASVALKEKSETRKTIATLAAFCFSTLAATLASQFLSTPITFTACFVLQFKILFVAAALLGVIGVIIRIALAILKLTPLKQSAINFELRLTANKTKNDSQ